MNFIHPGATIGANCAIGFFSVISEGAFIGSGTSIGNNVTVYPETYVGENCLVGDNCVIGKQPHPAKTSTNRLSAPLHPLRVGPGSILGSGVVLYAGTSLDEEVMVGDMASVRELCLVGSRVIIGRGVVLENDVTVGDYAKIQTGAYLTAHTMVGAGAFIAPMVVTANDNYMGRTEERFAKIKGPRIGENARVGAGAVILPGVAVAAETFVAAGALVTKDTLPGIVVAGCPARFIRDVPKSEKR
ncbi:MAG: Acyl-(acyl-carrier-protein)--UDP-N-acetylglucosamine O-acyltransferase [Pelotomaculum sp. PtaB.Bin013]|uniref:Acetyltransferase n=1 Tax=Pelotomaculum isophthalicicum JI TaxID=947010 RepID=A0A9X4JTS3_9FIRM|nr:acyltransferase [Pelotomaculum isophthalicicum]MDF9407870.1 acetyltransferase [Pelotomaculum isophthalicicum JI]OPX88875.1 MAG: Acyl-(acyl-carrier-protein)--UDP-N-acetylglucosamine O-acyltransferase [Pelotomaculum sp. PtaB.Bin013]